MWRKLALLVAFVWLLDWIRRRLRSQALYDAGRRRVRQVNVQDVIDRELQDQRSREALLAKLPTQTRYYDERRYELAWGFIPSTLRGARLLDAGCGDGYVLQETKKRFPARFKCFVGLDISHYKTVLAHKRPGGSTLLGVANVERLPFAAETFDVILCTEVLEHLIHVQPGISELSRLCRRGGRIILSTPSRHSMFFSFANPFTWLEALAGLLNPSLLPPFHNLEQPNDPHSVIHRAFTLQELEQELQGFDMTIVSSHFRLPGPVYRVVKSREMLEQIEKFLYQLPLVNRLGETLIVCAVKIQN